MNDLKHVSVKMRRDPRPEVLHTAHTVISVKTKILEELTKGTPREVLPNVEYKKGAREGARTFMLNAKEPNEVFAPVLEISNASGRTVGTWLDGRHRFGVLRDAGCEWINVCVMNVVALQLIAQGHAKRPVRERKEVVEGKKGKS